MINNLYSCILNIFWLFILSVHNISWFCRIYWGYFSRISCSIWSYTFWLVRCNCPATWYLWTFFVWSYLSWITWIVLVIYWSSSWNLITVFINWDNVANLSVSYSIFNIQVSWSCSLVTISCLICNVAINYLNVLLTIIKSVTFLVPSTWINDLTGYSINNWSTSKLKVTCITMYIISCFSTICVLEVNSFSSTILTSMFKGNNVSLAIVIFINCSLSSVTILVKDVSFAFPKLNLISS